MNPGTDDASPDANSWTDAIYESLGATEAIAGRVDASAFGGALRKAMGRAMFRPTALASAGSRFLADLTAIGAQSTAQALGMRAGALPDERARDKRFTDRAWTENAFFNSLVHSHAAFQRLVETLAEAGATPGVEASKARFGARLLADALAPSNYFATNPVALRRAFETGGLSVARGVKHFVDDLLHNDGWPRQVDTRPFKLGRNMAATPGKVVYRNRLIELIQYHPQTEQVRELPLLLCPPWINKYYVMDLAPSKSLAEWAVGHGFTTFAISYRNPDASMRDVKFEDYLRHGPLAAIDAIRTITGVDQVNTLAVCLGGTLNTCLLAYLDAIGSHRVNSSAYLNCLNDFSSAGTLGDVFTDGDALEKLHAAMAKEGYLEGKAMARTFDLLRANDLIFNYVVSNWLLGEEPPAFDLLAWNADSTNMPAAMHSEYLQRCYNDNALVKDEMVLLGERLVVSAISEPTYIVAAVDDHIVPWRASYRTTQVFKGPSRFVLSSSGHIAGIVNPPSPKSKLWVNDATPPDPDAWYAGAEQRDDTWWNDWADWNAGQSGGWVDPPSLGCDTLPVLCDAPGTYVFG